MTLYVYDKDTQPGTSLCTDECAAAWPPATPPTNAQPAGDWTIIVRADGVRQWAYQGKPLYRSTKDTQWGEMKGNAADSGVWHVARPNWRKDLRMPRGFALQQVAQAPGQVLATSKGLTLYAYSGDIRRDGLACAGPCDATFIPYVAPQAAQETSTEFKLVNRTDGVRQWAFKGKPLYVFSGDVEPGDENGAGVDKRFSVVLMVRYFVPNEVAIRSDQRFGGLWTTPSGMTLYARETARYPASGQHHARGGTQGLFQEGRSVGARPCEIGNKDICEQSFKPLLASAQAQPSGFWTIYDRADGTRQWAYQGYALYTYAQDKVPGDMIAHDMYDLIVNDSQQQAAPAQYQQGLYWRISTP
jgi:predicted lipoprotein with Yx(FWY)xxD motif